jgi:hypothetical protein
MTFEPIGMGADISRLVSQEPAAKIAHVRRLAPVYSRSKTCASLQVEPARGRYQRLGEQRSPADAVELTRRGVPTSRSGAWQPHCNKDRHHADGGEGQWALALCQF